MFGTLSPDRGGLAKADHGQWRRYYCGTCQSLGAHFGHGFRGLLSHDAVFLALLVDGLSVAAASPDRTRCPMLPVVHRPTVSPSSVAMRYAASVQILLADQWLADRALDGRSLAPKALAARSARPLLRASAARARETLRELGSDLGDLEGIEHEIIATEAAIDDHADPERAAEPTAAALERVFGRMAALPGLAVDDPAALERPLAQLGRAAGRAIYLIDALEDLEDDRRADAFNPCLVHDFRGQPQVSRGRLRQATAALERARLELREGLAQLPLRRHRVVLANILVATFGARAQAATQAAQEAYDLDRARRAAGWRGRLGLDRASLARKLAGTQRLLLAGLAVLRLPLRATSIGARALSAFAITLGTAAFTALNTWTSQAFAQPAKRRRKPKKTDSETDTDSDSDTETETETDSDTGTTDTDTDTTDTGTTDTDTTEGLGEELDDAPPELTDFELPDDLSGGGGGSGGSPCDDCFADFFSELCGGLAKECNLCGACSEGCGDALDNCTNGCCEGSCNACSDICGGCSGCGDACGECGGCSSACGDCGSACGDCGGACEGCGSGCNECGSGCNECGSGCNNCGSGCNGSSCNGC